MLFAAALHAPSIEALAIALQHPAITGDLRAVCSLLQTCKAWRAALQQCTAGHLSINVGTCPAIHQPKRLSRFAVWLTKHSGLVGGLNFLHRHPATADLCAAAEQVLALSVQHAATRVAAAGTAPLLRLRSVSLDFLYSPLLLQALPAAALTQLSVMELCQRPAHLSLNSSSITACFRQLSNLQHLFADAERNPVNNACLAAVGQLQLLTKLQVSRVGHGGDLSLLPGQLRQLHLEVCCSASEGSNSSSTVDLAHLTALQQLNLLVQGDPGAGSSLPASLTGLTVCGNSSSGGSSLRHFSFAPLQRLQQLQLCDAMEVQQLQALSSLSALSSLALTYNNIRHASDAAAAWGHLPALKSLYLSHHCHVALNELGDGLEQHRLGRAANLALLHGLAAATSLTGFTWYGMFLKPDEPWCQHLSSLQQLRKLQLIYQPPFNRADVLQLAALTNLTALRISAATAVDDAAAAGLALRLTNLQQLYLDGVKMISAAALPVIAALTGLTQLRLYTCTSAAVADKLGHGDLLLLTALTRLEEFETDGLFDYDAVCDVWDDECCGWRQPRN